MQHLPAALLKLELNQQLSLRHADVIYADSKFTSTSYSNLLLPVFSKINATLTNSAGTSKSQAVGTIIEAVNSLCIEEWSRSCQQLANQLKRRGTGIEEWSRSCQQLANQLKRSGTVNSRWRSE
ncbi:hypothetical protein F511_40478 [Dorcoceras hygrometricum]|uniref:Uncharacterized protein n=1 Tax=Dorcoceras hygrometricum TaxID=472368 RepID=A0A2Z7AH30_9LAMI|nr:hypothetical protein F511_40478 [Dorcoceras hygrometricum]